ncbi:hypothetical protein ID850_04180 [Xenorhabdus sp. Flor]|uniref:hypothetical protein n=1 Tax=Xenorhabdus cabanillasii TaxID=351673 RepID=UPI0004B1FC72|nr:hypothetical protein [Xenorhabdus sp. Flor]MBD2813977.1 hypothetical protein [Xenorhabdus sp. Flor]
MLVFRHYGRSLRIGYVCHPDSQILCSRALSVELLQERALCSALRFNAPRSEPVIRVNASIS